VKLTWKQQDFQEVVGQLPPTLLAIPLTLLFGQMRSLRGKANINDSDKMSIPENVQQIFESVVLRP